MNIILLEGPELVVLLPGLGEFGKNLGEFVQKLATLIILWLKKKRTLIPLFLALENLRPGHGYLVVRFRKWQIVQIR